MSLVDVTPGNCFQTSAADAYVITVTIIFFLDGGGGKRGATVFGVYSGKWMTQLMTP